MPTKTEQADLMLAMYGRHGEAPMPIIAPATPADAFETTVEACRIAVKYMTPVQLLSDGYIANSSEPWRLPDMESLPDISRPFAVKTDDEFLPYVRDPETLARPWAIPGTAGLEHRIGGLEHADLTGNVEYSPENHERMTLLREQKIAGIAKDIPELGVFGPENGDVLVLGWGGTYGPIRAAVMRMQEAGHSVAHAHVRHLFPFPSNIGELLSSYRKVLIPELNRGQLTRLLRAEFLLDIVSYPKIQGVPFKAAEISTKIGEVLADLEAQA
jgi:2-oxoglutarate ferredoxin oxidoreductase subunit alpha